jgi:putative endonuclease
VQRHPRDLGREPVPRSVGTAGEEAAAAWYRGNGYRIVARNWRCRLGELDLLLVRRATLVVCEVKARRGGGFGGPFDAVTRRKQHKLRTLAEAFLATGEIHPDEVRFDVASVTVDARGHASVHVFEQAF